MMLSHHQAARIGVRPAQLRAFAVRGRGVVRRNMQQQHLQVKAQAANKQTFSSFDDMIEKSELPLLVDFYATWCGPCQLLSPILQSVGASLKGRVQVVKIDSDKYPVLASRYSIQALPTMVMFYKGQPVDRIEGLPSERQLLERVQAKIQALGV